MPKFVPFHGASSTRPFVRQQTRAEAAAEMKSAMKNVLKNQFMSSFVKSSSSSSSNSSSSKDASSKLEELAPKKQEEIKKPSFEIIQAKQPVPLEKVVHVQPIKPGTLFVKQQQVPNPILLQQQQQARQASHAATIEK